MNIRKLPGTTIEADLSKPGVADDILSSIFLGGGLVLSQVSSLSGLEPHIVQNWVKRGFVSPPIGKKYTKRQFCRIAIINFLKDSLQIDKIVRLIGYINGDLADEGDDRMDDSRLYCLFVECVSKMDASGAEDIPKAIRRALAGTEAEEETIRRLQKVLSVMAVLYVAALYMGRADQMLIEIEEGLPC